MKPQGEKQRSVKVMLKVQYFWFKYLERNVQKAMWKFQIDLQDTGSPVIQGL